jgi:hypothetical protein
LENAGIELATSEGYDGNIAYPPSSIDDTNGTGSRLFLCDDGVIGVPMIVVTFHVNAVVAPLVVRQQWFPCECFCHVISVFIDFHLC